ncbi:MAG: cephalosporin hydroxylase family protein [Pseudodesulfovibrio sp.]|uniref:Cephalosporin hydroxylase n=1 Tax=Pseudodesulfovibrio aespoeensis (strain ATCC 700646 / DSM 10631 / Aspo-2) TaxID=643562 RepID=E6VSB8_PSEA9|nr:MULTISPECIES: cephalosporin hydroxylase family protein [Pseudodesulfovibrio]MBU4378910.1 cephalosporin hydroxylase family protein [Pseudomonadota bacterium]ADU64261.1 cephalosporin hydroxylase [Pseudodesulfovibrio aespoeensis Aspo-2]MBU4516440.1 cephalosporin hydroxylase family protein [Pseudomonadota bacterium]MBU4523087.1 cephalosporin hydroxylase family protein [Pseudomonadota bacterium]MBU4558053.1 cephalosporin hydroxylase family protein [Pseudomonadota bacterium]
MSNPVDDFRNVRRERIGAQGQNSELKRSADAFMHQSIPAGYSYNFEWLGRPIIQYPQDIMAMQELIWTVQPDIIIETGIAHGGTVLFHASMLQLLGGDRKTVSIDIDIREHNRKEIEAHPVFKNVTMLEGSSISLDIVDAVFSLAKGRTNPMVILDSNHTHEHVLREMELYAPLVKKGSYMVVFDTIVELLSEQASADRPWGPGNNPMTAVDAFLKTNDRFVPDTEIDNKLMFSVAPRGYLKCVKDM